MTNKNLISANKFQVIINKFPDIEIFAQRVALPSITLGISPVYSNTPYTVYTPGDKIEYEDFMISFLIDEDLETYTTILDWLTNISQTDEASAREFFSDMSIMTLTNNSNANKKFLFKDCFPYSISNVLLDVEQREDTPLTADVIFKFATYNVE